MSKRRVLQDHIKQGNTFYPPFLARGQELNLKSVDWQQRILPEVFWLAPLVHDHGMEKAGNLACGLIQLMCQVSGDRPVPNIGTLTSFTTLKTLEKKELRDRLRVCGLLGALRSSLDPVLRLYPRCPLRFLLRKREVPSIRKRPAMEYLAPLLWDCLFRREKLPTLVQGVYYDMALVSGRLFFEKGLRPVDSGDLQDYPDSQESQRAAGFIRCHVSTISQVGDPSFWPEYFWQRGNELGPCDVLQDDFPPLWAHPQDFMLFHMDCFRLYSEETMQIWETVEKSRVLALHQPLRDEILMGLAARVYRLTVQFVSFFANWTEDIAQVFVRMVAESYIYWKWLREKGTNNDFMSFYDHGLGQQKLYMEHINAYLAQHGVSEDEIDEGNPGLDFLKNHKRPDFVAVNVGNPFNKNLRQLSEEADVKEMYALVFGPTSSMVHGMYDSLDRYYLRRCVNPFHGLHRIPFYWTKSPVSGYGAANMLRITDWVLSDMLHDAGIAGPEEMPGFKYIERLYDESAFNEFREQPEVSMNAEKRTHTLRNLMADLK